MFNAVFAKRHIYSLIVIALLEICIADKIEMLENEAALHFAYEWLATPKMYFGVILPSKNLFKVHDILTLTKKINSYVEGKSAYFLINSNITKFKTIPHTQKELIWYPFNTRHYDMNCLFLGSPRYDRLYKKHFLFLHEYRNNINFSFETCKIRFDSRLVTYRQQQNNQSTVEFEEIYKIDENENKLEKNTLREIVKGRKDMQLSTLNLSIWNRRKSLKGINFKAVSIKSSKTTTFVKKSKDSKGNVVIHHSGYFGSILEHMMQDLNFSLNTSVADKSFNDIVMEVGSGRYDIGINSFAHILARDNYADYSRELLESSFGLFYVKEQQKLYMETFLNPFTSNTWVVLTAYIIVMISGFTLVTMVKGKKTHVSTLKRICELIQKGSNMVLRSLISKRQSAEPINFSSKISFLALVFTGFFVFSMYRAVLVSFLATEEDNPPIGNLKELVHSDYRLAVPKGSAVEGLFLNAATDSDEYQVYKNNKILSFQESANGFANMMVYQDPKASKTVLYYVYAAIQINKNYPCKLALIKGSKSKFGSEGMIFSKRSPWVDYLNYHLFRMKESGLIERLYERDMVKRSISCPNEYTINRVVKKPGPVDTNKTISLYLVLVAGFGMSSLFLLGETLSARQQQLTSV